MTESDSTKRELPELSGGKELPPLGSARVIIPDYDLLRHIGAGAFGEVWLARSKATGRYRAIKIIYRERLPDQGAYDVEFAGLKKFEEVSREHLGFIDILHISRDDQARHFYYVMELADDVETGQQIAESSYASKTLATELKNHGRLPISQCVEVALTLAEALGHLHQRGLVHRDIKPANIVFVRGGPKLADIGLVTDATPSPHTLLRGTLPYMDPQVHGTVQGDLFSLGKIIYVMATGRRAAECPQWPPDAMQGPDFEDFAELDRIFRKACNPDPALRYISAEEIRQVLLPLRTSAALRRLEKWTHLLAAIKRYAFIGVILLALGGVAVYQWRAKLRQQAEMRDRLAGSYVAYGTRALENLDPLGSLPWFAEALRLDGETHANAQTHYLRLNSVLQNSPTIVQMWFNNWAGNYAAFASQENQLLIPAVDGRWGIHDLSSGQPIQPLFGQTNWKSVSFSAVADLAVLGIRTNYLRLYTLSTGKELSPLIYTTNLHVAALSPDGQWVAAGALDNSVVLWSLRAGYPPRILHGHSNYIFHVNFSHDSTRLASAGPDNQVILWNALTGERLPPVIQHRHWVYHVSFSPDDKFLASSSFDRSARLWDVATGAEAPYSFWHDDAVYSVEFSTDGQQIITACLDFTVRIWERSTGRLLQQLRHDARPVYAAFSPQGRHVVTATHDGTIRVWNLRPGGQSQDMPGVLTFAQDGRHYVESNNQLVLKDFSAPQTARPVPTVNSQCLNAIVSHRAEKLLFIAALPPPALTNEARAILWDGVSAESIPLALSVPVPLPEMVLNPAGNLVALVNTNTHQVTVWDLEANRLLVVFPKTEPGPITFDPQGRTLAVSSGKKVEVRSLFPPAPQPTHVLTHSTPVESIVWSHTGQRLVTTCRQTETFFAAEAARIWDPSTGKLVGRPLQHKDGVCFAAFSPDDRIIVSCGEDFVAMLWDAETGRLLAPPLRHKHQVLHAAFSENHRWLATACRNGTVRVWDIRDIWRTRNVEPITPPLPHGESVRFVQFLNADKLLCARNDKEQFRIWQLSTNGLPFEDLMMISELLSAQQVRITNGQSRGAQIVGTTTKQVLQRTWERLHSKYPAEFGLAPR